VPPHTRATEIAGEENCLELLTAGTPHDTAAVDTADTAAVAEMLLLLLVAEQLAQQDAPPLLHPLLLHNNTEYALQ
jgi:hypothetical protein